jgi:NTP pyrophosphatase (non-canonical NTP hydrolase)
VTIEEIQKWEWEFAKRKGVPQDYEAALKMAILKLGEETGEVYRGILKEDWENVQEECFDVLSFLCKITSLMEEFHGARKWSDVIQEKIDTVEKRGKIDPKTHRATKIAEEIERDKNKEAN